MDTWGELPHCQIPNISFTFSCKRVKELRNWLSYLIPVFHPIKTTQIISLQYWQKYNLIVSNGTIRSATLIQLYGREGLVVETSGDITMWMNSIKWTVPVALGVPQKNLTNSNSYFLITFFIFPQNVSLPGLKKEHWSINRYLVKWNLSVQRHVTDVRKKWLKQSGFILLVWNLLSYLWWCGTARTTYKFDPVKPPFCS